MSTLWSTRHNNTPKLLPFDKERVARRRARWARLGRIGVVLFAAAGVVALVILVFIWWLVGARE